MQIRKVKIGDFKELKEILNSNEKQSFEIFIKEERIK